MKKLCFITTIYPTIPSFVLATALKLHETGKYEITLMSSDHPNVKNDIPDYIHHIPVSMERGINISAIKAIIKFFKTFNEEKFDYIQYSTPNASFYASIAAFLTRSPLRVYGQWGLRYVGASGFGRKILKFLEKITCLLSTHIRPVSRKNMEFAIEEKLYKPDKANVIGNGGTIGISLDEFDIEKKDKLRKDTLNKYDINSNTFVFGFVGRMSRDKGSIELLQAFKNLSDKGYDIKLFVVGDNEFNGLKDEIIEWAENSDKIIFTGRRPVTELSSFYSAFDCYVHPTYREGFGMVLQEAGAMGNAIITTDVPGASEVMEKDVSCILVKPKDVLDLQNAMEYIVKNPEAAADLGKHAYERTVALYERSIMLNNIAADIEKILKERK